MTASILVPRFLSLNFGGCSFTINESIDGVVSALIGCGSMFELTLVVALELVPKLNVARQESVETNSFGLNCIINADLLLCADKHCLKAK